jgi:hypothetical protein
MSKRAAFNWNLRAIYFCVFQLALAAPACASPIWLMNSDMLALLQITGNQGQCFLYTYDLNGNRLAGNNLIYGASGTWGTSVYGCFDWASS